MRSLHKDATRTRWAHRQSILLRRLRAMKLSEVGA